MTTINKQLKRESFIKGEEGFSVSATEIQNPSVMKKNVDTFFSKLGTLMVPVVLAGAILVGIQIDKAEAGSGYIAFEGINPVVSAPKPTENIQKIIQKSNATFCFQSLDKQNNKVSLHQIQLRNDISALDKLKQLFYYHSDKVVFQQVGDNSFKQVNFQELKAEIKELQNFMEKHNLIPGTKLSENDAKKISGFFTKQNVEKTKNKEKDEVNINNLPPSPRNMNRL